LIDRSGEKKALIPNITDKSLDVIFVQTGNIGTGFLEFMPVEDCKALQTGYRSGHCLLREFLTIKVVLPCVRRWGGGI
jgi:hypothetical protein